MYTKDIETCNLTFVPWSKTFAIQQIIFSINERMGFNSMPKALKWGLIIMVCILVLFVAGYFIPGWVNSLFRDVAGGEFPYGAQESSAPYMETEGGSSPWETGSDSAGDNR